MRKNKMNRGDKTGQSEKVTCKILYSAETSIAISKTNRRRTVLQTSGVSECHDRENNKTTKKQRKDGTKKPG